MFQTYAPQPVVYFYVFISLLFFVNCRQVSVLRPNCHMWLVIYKMFSFYKLAAIQSLKVQLEDDVKRRTQDNHYFF